MLSRGASGNAAARQPRRIVERCSVGRPGELRRGSRVSDSPASGWKGPQWDGEARLPARGESGQVRLREERLGRRADPWFSRGSPRLSWTAVAAMVALVWRTLGRNGVAVGPRAAEAGKGEHAPG